ncbi:hypothetical protein ANCCAN_23332 [Ancylostoma caninum]|uniref:Uncharacterized protein n=1 Tax=Ancylostoma caninum TaxID=29170 RepID=A0A368FIT9_ANCCA|nr:hypothetical protein ANCCAN_23332 [Ancylostoma caninum]
MDGAAVDGPTVDGLEIIDFTKKGALTLEKALAFLFFQDGSQRPLEIRLTNGKKVLIHEENAYKNYYEDGRSFEQLEGKEEADLLEFQFDFQVHKDGLKEMKAVGNTIHSNPMAVYHANVLWCYAYGLSVAEENNNGKGCVP